MKERRIKPGHLVTIKWGRDDLQLAVVIKIMWSKYLEVITEDGQVYRIPPGKVWHNHGRLRKIV